MGFSSRLAVAAWAAGLTTTALALSLGGCAREPGDPLPETRVVVNAADLESGRCVDSCEPDYGSRPVDCAAAEAGIEFFPFPVWDFTGTAAEMYAYTDNTTENLATNNCPPDVDCDINAYAPVTTPIERCGVMNDALHVRGGPFREWGGGVGRRLVNFVSGSCPIPPPPERDPATPSFCPHFDQRLDDAPGRTLPDGTVKLPPDPTNVYAMMVDLREWEGISFWARRGPDSQGGFRIALGDRNTDDDIAFLEFNSGLTPRCSRIKQCECRQQDKFCLPIFPDVTPEQTYCWNPATDAPSATPDEDNWERCGAWSCDQPYAAFTNIQDLAFATPATGGSNVCAPYAFATDQTGQYCYDPANGPPPAESTERCGDTWLDPVGLSTDWQFFKVPFSELRQEGWAKRFPRLELSAVTMVRFTWSVGWVDYWIDDVRFYRRKK